jgi:hypothetical protein
METTKDQIISCSLRYGCDPSLWSDEFVAWLLALCNSDLKVPVPYPSCSDSIEYFNYLCDYLEESARLQSVGGA